MRNYSWFRKETYRAVRHIELRSNISSAITHNLKCNDILATLHPICFTEMMKYFPKYVNKSFPKSVENFCFYYCFWLISGEKSVENFKKRWKTHFKATLNLSPKNPL